MQESKTKAACGVLSRHDVFHFLSGMAKSALQTPICNNLVYTLRVTVELDQYPGAATVAVRDWHRSNHEQASK